MWLAVRVGCAAHLINKRIIHFDGDAPTFTDQHVKQVEGIDGRLSFVKDNYTVLGK